MDWVTKNGKVIPIQEMGTDHIINTLKMLKRDGKDVLPFVTEDEDGRPWFDWIDNPVYLALENELTNRKPSI